MTGAVDVVGATVDVVGVSSWVSPGMAVDNFCRPRPLVELPPDVDEPAPAMPDKGDEVEDVVVVGLETAPASDNELAVVVVEVLVGVLVLDVVLVRVVTLLVCVVVELSIVVVGALTNVDVEVEDVVVPSSCIEVRGDDFLMSLWDLRTGAVSLVESVLEVVLRSDRRAFS